MAEIQSDKVVMANQQDTVAVDKQRKEAVVIYIAVLSNNNIRKKDQRESKKT